MSKGFSSRFSQQRRTLRPIRPNPLMAVLVDDPAAIAVAARTCCSRARPVLGHLVITVIASPVAPTKPALPTGMATWRELMSGAASALAPVLPRAREAAPMTPSAAPMDAAALQPEAWALVVAEARYAAGSSMKP